MKQALCVLLFCGLAFLGAVRDFVTHDEGPFLHYGIMHLRGEVPRRQVWNSKLPVTALHALPGVVSGRPAIVEEGGRPNVVVSEVLPARVMGVLLGGALVLAIGLGARSLLTARAAAAAALFAALEPNLLAHCHLVTADGGATLACFLLVLATARLVRTGKLGDAALAGAATGLVLLCKFMLVVWVFVALGVAIARGVAPRLLLVAILVANLVLCAGFFFRGLPGHLPENPRSAKVQLAERVLGRAPLPFPESYLDGLDWTAGDEEHGRGFGNLYLLGETQTDPKRGWPWYYLVAFALKLPLPLLGLAALGMAWNRDRAWWTPRAFAVGWLIFLSFFNRAQIGIRHALPIVPLLIVEAAAAYARLEKERPWLARGAIVWLALSVVSFAPDFLPYTNELVYDRRSAYRVLADSNLDWGQADQAARAFLADHRDVKLAPPGPVSGKVLVSVNALVGVVEPPEKFAWLRERRPVEHVRHAYLLFEVP